jgi:3-dehydroquinate synthase II
MLIGSSSSFLYLVNSETIENPFVPVRPFRVNAGAVSNYVLLPDGKTKYLSEVDSGDRVLVTKNNGNCRACIVGRVKIETRPLMLVKASCGEKSGSILLQDAETINLVQPDGKPLSLSNIKQGDKVLVVASSSLARHMGIPIEGLLT